MRTYEPIFIDKRYYTFLPIEYRMKVIEEFRQYYMNIMLSRLPKVEEVKVE